MRFPYDFNPPPNRSRMKGTDAQREEWWQIRCWLKPRLIAVGVTTEQWHRHKRNLQQHLRENGYESTAQEAELLLHRIRTAKRKEKTS
jgi:hypothetical protein